MIGLNFNAPNGRELKVIAAFGTTDDGQPLWLCREYYTDNTEYLTTAEINENLSWAHRLREQWRKI